MHPPEKPTKSCHQCQKTPSALAEHGYTENDWEKNPNSESHRQRLRDKGRSELRRWIDDWADPHIQEVNARWKARIEE